MIQDRAHGVFLGKMTVRPGADGTDAHQLNQNLLLSPQASIDTKPELEIFADEVKCSHGATVGDLDEEALFYLQARGIPQAAARHMLVEAFAASAIEAAALGQDSHVAPSQERKGLAGWGGSRLQRKCLTAGVMNWQISPHPVLLPMGEGTPE